MQPFSHARTVKSSLGSSELLQECLSHCVIASSSQRVNKQVVRKSQTVRGRSVTLGAGKPKTIFCQKKACELKFHSLQCLGFSLPLVFRYRAKLQLCSQITHGCTGPPILLCSDGSSRPWECRQLKIRYANKKNQCHTTASQCQDTPTLRR